jgi:hypothetical protein
MRVFKRGTRGKRGRERGRGWIYLLYYDNSWRQMEGAGGYQSACTAGFLTPPPQGPLWGVLG